MMTNQERDLTPRERRISSAIMLGIAIGMTLSFLTAYGEGLQEHISALLEWFARMTGVFLSFMPCMILIILVVLFLSGIALMLPEPKDEWNE